jgi:hypothetical protein
MTTTRKPTSHAAYLRRVDDAAASLASAHRLWSVLRDAISQDWTNQYLRDAYESAQKLCNELEGDMEYHMDEAVAAGVDPERWM